MGCLHIIGYVFVGVRTDEWELNNKIKWICVKQK